MDRFDRLHSTERLLARYSQGQASTSGAYSETDSDIPDDAEIEFDEDLPRPPTAAGTLHRVVAAPLLAARAALPTTLAASPSASSVATSDSLQVDTAASSEARGRAGVAAAAQGFPPQALGATAASAPLYGALVTGRESPAAAAQQPASPGGDSAALLQSQRILSSSPERAPVHDAAVERQLQEATAATESLFRMLSSPVQELLSAQASRLELEDAEPAEYGGAQVDGWEKHGVQHALADVGVEEAQVSDMQQPQGWMEGARTALSSSLVDRSADVPPHAPLVREGAAQGRWQAQADTSSCHNPDPAGLAAAPAVPPGSRDVSLVRVGLLAPALAETVEAAVQAVCGVDVAVQTTRHAESSMQRVEVLGRAQPWFWGREALAAQTQENRQDRVHLAELRRRLAGLDPR
ncbi:hypothetical protein N2152v2_001970 [Parachlorella kessleri]